jgi:RNA polymerase sigma factor (sigma-70 family)
MRMPDIPVRMGAFQQALVTASSDLQSSKADSATRFERIFREHSRAILGYATRRVPRPDQGADVLSEVMLVAWRRLPEVPEGSDERLWLYGVARRVIANQTRSAARRGRLGAKLRAELAALDPNSRDRSDSYATRELVQTALAELPETDRELIQLNIWEGLGPTEIAVVIGETAGTVRTRLHRARARLRSLLIDVGLDEIGESS